MHSDWYRFFAGFWWLIFPIGLGVAGMLRAWMRHKRAQQALEVIKSYADQGKEIPSEVLRVLQQPEQKSRSPLYGARGLTMIGFIFTALAVAFCVLIIGRIAGDDREAFVGMTFVAVLMAGCAVAFFLTGHLLARDSKRLDPP